MSLFLPPAGLVDKKIRPVCATIRKLERGPSKKVAADQTEIEKS
jgi:hypothetical protein